MDVIVNTVGKLCSGIDNNVLVIVVGICIVLAVLSMIKKAVSMLITCVIVCLLATGILWVKDEVLVRNDIKIEDSMISVHGTEFNLDDISKVDIVKSKNGESSNVEISLKQGNTVVIDIPSDKVWIIKSILSDAVASINE